MITDFAVIESPSSKLTWCTPESDDSDIAFDASLRQRLGASSQVQSRCGRWLARLKHNGSRFIERPLPRFSGDLPVCQPIINNRIRCKVRRASAGGDCGWESRPGPAWRPGDSSAPLADFREGRTELRPQALRNERHVVMQGED